MSSGTLVFMVVQTEARPNERENWASLPFRVMTNEIKGTALPQPRASTIFQIGAEFRCNLIQS